MHVHKHNLCRFVISYACHHKQRHGGTNQKPSLKIIYLHWGSLSNLTRAMWIWKTNPCILAETKRHTKKHDGRFKLALFLIGQSTFTTARANFWVLSLGSRLYFLSYKTVPRLMLENKVINRVIPECARQSTKYKKLSTYYYYYCCYWRKMRTVMRVYTKQSE